MVEGFHELQPQHGTVLDTEPFIRQALRREHWRWLTCVHSGTHTQRFFNSCGLGIPGECCRESCLKLERLINLAFLVGIAFRGQRRAIRSVRSFR